MRHDKIRTRAPLARQAHEMGGAGISEGPEMIPAGPGRWGERFRRLRLAAGLSQERVAAAAEIRSMTLSNIESGRSMPRTSTVASLARALGLEATQLESFCADGRPVVRPSTTTATDGLYRCTVIDDAWAPLLRAGDVLGADPGIDLTRGTEFVLARLRRDHRIPDASPVEVPGILECLGGERFLRRSFYGAPESVDLVAAHPIVEIRRRSGRRH